uniref:Uncharacterized protein n=1 Tax=Arundo donax TaxID=35708 RepID=A0A0A9AEU3_ARUDO
MVSLHIFSSVTGMFVVRI